MAFSQQQDDRMGPGRVGDTFIYKYKGTQIGIYGNTDSESGYADISIKDKAGNVVFQTSIDFYSLKPAKVIKKI